jgi:hypothetical protein
VSKPPLPPATVKVELAPRPFGRTNIRVLDSDRECLRRMMSPSVDAANVTRHALETLAAYRESWTKQGRN